LILCIFILLVIFFLVTSQPVTVKFTVVRCKLTLKFCIQAVGACQVTEKLADVTIIQCQVSTRGEV
jgi:hypothetical protein